jgi:hypothetical protein
MFSRGLISHWQPLWRGLDCEKPKILYQTGEDYRTPELPPAALFNLQKRLEVRGLQSQKHQFSKIDSRLKTFFSGRRG